MSNLGDIQFSNTTPVAETGKRLAKYQNSGAAPNPTFVSWETDNFGGVNIQSGTTYTLQLSDEGKLIVFTSSSSVAVTADSTLLTYFRCTLLFLGAAGGSIAPSSGTINGVSSITMRQNQGGEVFFNGTNWWIIPVLGGGSSGGYTYLPAATFPPAASSFSWINQASCTAADKADGILLMIPNGSTNNTLFVQSVTPGAWTLTAAFSYIMWAANYNGFGLAATDGTKIYRWIYQSTGGASVFNASIWTNFSTLSSSFYNSPALAAGSTIVVWLRLVDDGTTSIHFQLSFDGFNFMELTTTARTFATASKVGLVMTNGTSTPINITLVSWMLTSP